MSDTQAIETEREFKSGLLGRNASFRLIVVGSVGVKEIQHLIKHLKLDLEILEEQQKASAEPTEREGE